MLRRVIDLVGSSALVILNLPILLITAFAVWATDQGPIFYRQKRSGLLGHPFELVKFRSMRVNNLPLDRPGEVEQNDPLVTTLGKWIRRLKVDELPQLFNVMRGDMSLIGPRPTLPEQVERYSPFQRRRLEVLPGMTGWSQVSGGTEISWPERIILDVWYVDHRSLSLDIRIMWRTLGVIIRGHKPMPAAMEQALRYARKHADVVELELPVCIETHNCAELALSVRNER